MNEQIDHTEFEELEPALDSAVRAVLSEPFPDAAVERVKARAKRLNSPTVFAGRHRFAGLPVVAVLVGVVVCVTWLFSSGDRFAFAEVQAALKNITTAVFNYHYPNAPSNDTRSFISAKPRITRLEGANGYVAVISNKGTLRLNTKKKVAQKSPGQAFDAGDLNVQHIHQIITQAQGKAIRQLGKRRFDGQDLMGFLVPVDAFDKKNDFLSEKMCMEVWVDGESKLPVRIEVKPVTAGDVRADFQHQICDVKFNVPLDMELFSMEPPAGYRLLEESELFPFPGVEKPKHHDSEKWTILPGQGIGAARFGMSVEQVIEELGKPDSTMEGADEDAVFLNYAGVGCQILVYKSKGMSVISCWHESMMNVGAFIGSTQEGLSISSSPDDVRRVYGEPSAANEAPDGIGLHLRYSDKSMGFHFQNQQLILISVEQPK